MDSSENKQGLSKEGNPVYSTTDTSKVNLSENEWKKILPEEVYYIARQKGTEAPWTSKFEKSFETGTYYCAVCGNALFKSDTGSSVVGLTWFTLRSSRPLSQEAIETIASASIQ